MSLVVLRAAGQIKTSGPKQEISHPETPCVLKCLKRKPPPTPPSSIPPFFPPSFYSKQAALASPFTRSGKDPSSQLQLLRPGDAAAEECTTSKRNTG